MFVREGFHRKDSGMLDQILPLFVGILILSVVFALMLGTMESIQTKNKVDLVARRAILLLETYGYIDSSMQKELKAQLEEAKITNIQITTRGCTDGTGAWGPVSESNPAAYGQKVEVVITGETTMATGRVAGANLFATIFQRETAPVRVVRVSTSKN